MVFQKFDKLLDAIEAATNSGQHDQAVFAKEVFKSHRIFLLTTKVWYSVQALINVYLSSFQEHFWSFYQNLPDFEKKYYEVLCKG